MPFDIQQVAQRARRPLLLAVATAVLSIGLAGCEKPAEKAYRERYAKAEALFKERCKNAKVVIHRTVTDVEGIELTKVRPKLEWADKRYFDPMFEGAAMAGEVKGEDYIKQFLMHEFVSAERPGVRGQIGPSTIEKKRTYPDAKKGYTFVEYIDAKGAQRYRCTPDWSRDHPNWVDGQHQCVPVQASSARYALDYEDLVDPADRALWVAGTKLKVIDKQTGEVISTLIKFTWDRGFGVSTTGRLPWVYANTAASTYCPSDATQPQGSESRYFIDTVLVPKQGD